MAMVLVQPGAGNRLTFRDAPYFGKGPLFVILCVIRAGRHFQILCYSPLHGNTILLYCWLSVESQYSTLVTVKPVKAGNPTF